MSAILGFGGIIYDIVAVFNTYVEYRPVDPTLNIANYEPIYAVRGMLPDEHTSPEPDHWEDSSFGLQHKFVLQPTASDTGVTAAREALVGVDTTLPVGSEVPEPGYTFILAVLFVTLWMWLIRRNQHRHTYPHSQAVT